MFFLLFIYLLRRNKLNIISNDFNQSYSTRDVGISLYYSRDLPEGTFTRFQGDNIPEGPPQFDSEGHKILTDEDFSYPVGEEINTDEESE